MAGEITGFKVTGDSTVRKIDYDALANKPTIPTKVSDLDNDSGFITEESIDNVSIRRNQNGELYALAGGTVSDETDPTVPSWAKQPSKPTYTAQEVGALPSTTSVPTKTSDLTNDSGFITSIPVDNDTIMINEYGELYVALGIAEEETF